MSVFGPKAWMPSDMLDADKDRFVALHPDDPHAAAAAAWEAWAATKAPEPVVGSVATGAQSISYMKGFSEYSACLERADWHRARAKVRSVAVGPLYTRSGNWWVPDDEFDGGTIPTEHVGPLKP